MTTRYKQTALAVMWIGFAIATEALSAVQPLRIEDVANARYLLEYGGIGALSPDGRWLAYSLCDPRRHPEKSESPDAAVDSAQLTPRCAMHVTSIGDSRLPVSLEGANGNDWAPVWSPDGRQLAFLSDREGGTHAWLWDRQTTALRQISESEVMALGDAARPTWTRDGSGLLLSFPSAEVDTTQLARTQGEAVPGTISVPTSTLELYRSLPDGDRSSAELSGTPGMRNPPLDLGILDIESGSIRYIIRNVTISWFDLSPDGRYVAYIEAQPGKLSAHRLGLLSRLKISQVENGDPQILVSDLEQGNGAAISWSPDGRYLAYVNCAGIEPSASAEVTIYASACGDLFVVSPTGGVPQRFSGAPSGELLAETPPLWNSTATQVIARGRADALWQGDVSTATVRRVPLDTSVGSIVRAGDGRTYWSSDGGMSAFVRTSDEQSMHQGFARVDLTSGRVKIVLSGPEGLGIGNFGLEAFPPVVSADGRTVAFFRQSASASPDLYIADVDFKSPRRVTKFNPQLEEYEFGSGKVIEYLNSDGEPLRAAVLLPADFRADKRYPTIVWVYAAEYGSRYSSVFGLNETRMFNLQMLATRGYVVLWPDIPVKVGTSMRDLMKSVMPAIDKALELGISDPDRLAVMGHSNGGWSTIGLLVQTDRFKAAVMNAGFADLTERYFAHAESFLGAPAEAIGIWSERSQGAMGAPPWEVPLRYLENSPIYYMDRVSTPLIIMAGSEDDCCIRPSDATFLALKRLRKDVTYLRYRGEGHDLHQYPNLLDYWNRVTAFLAEHLTHAPSNVSAH